MSVFPIIFDSKLRLQQNENVSTVTIIFFQVITYLGYYISTFVGCQKNLKACSKINSRTCHNNSDTVRTNKRKTCRPEWIITGSLMFPAWNGKQYPLTDSRETPDIAGMKWQVVAPKGSLREPWCCWYEMRIILRGGILAYHLTFLAKYTSIPARGILT